MHLSQVQLRIADLWKGAFKSELLLKVGEEIINFVINATVLEAVIKKQKQNMMCSVQEVRKSLNCIHLLNRRIHIL